MPSLTNATRDEINSIEAALEAELIKRAIDQKIASKESDLVVRDILPLTDFGYSTEEWTQTISASAYGVAIVSNINLDSKKLIGFYGVTNTCPNPKAISLKWALGTGGTKVKDIWHIQKMYAQTEDPLLVTKEPLVYDSKDTLYVTAYGRLAGQDELILLGKVVEKAGENIMG